jgi:hypothetical protein
MKSNFNQVLQMNFSRNTKMITSYAVLCVVAGLALGVIWHFIVFAVDASDELHPLDVSFYWKLHLAIGGVSGGLAWYSAFLVEKHRIRPFSLAAILAIPLMFVFVLAIDKNPITAVAIIVLFAIGMIPTLIAMRSRQMP